MQYYSCCEDEQVLEEDWNAIENVQAQLQGLITVPKFFAQLNGVCGSNEVLVGMALWVVPNLVKDCLAWNLAVIMTLQGDVLE